MIESEKQGEGRYIDDVCFKKHREETDNLSRCCQCVGREAIALESENSNCAPQSALHINTGSSSNKTIDSLTNKYASQVLKAFSNLVNC